MNFSKIRPPAPHAAGIADSRAPGYALSGYVVRAVTVVLEAGAFAAIPLRATTDANLVEEAGCGAGRDEPLTATLVALKDVGAVKLGET